MPETQQLPYLLALVDDPSGPVREVVARELRRFGAALEEVLLQLPTPALPAQIEAVRNLLTDPDLWRRSQQEWLAAHWPAWREAPNETARLETALCLLSQFQQPPSFPPGRVVSDVSGLLDELAERFGAWKGPKDEVGLARFLFLHCGLKGARADYYDPRNSDLAYVIAQKHGIPISLACVYILTGRRCGLRVDGCNWPGHFFARIHTKEGLMLVDCFHDGLCIDETSFLKMQGPSREAAQHLIATPADADTIVARVLHNLARAYQQSEQWENSQFMTELLRGMRERPRGSVN